MLSRNFFHRTFIGCLFSFIVGCVIAYSQTSSWIFLLGVMGFQAVALAEFYGICRAKGFAPASTLGISLSCLYVLSRYFAALFPQTALVPCAIALFGALLIAIIHLSTKEGAIANFGLTVFGLIFVTLPIALIIDINFLPRLNNFSTSFWLIFLLIVTKGSDVLAYLAGKTVGKHLLATRLSPKKTIEGAIAGVCGAALLAILTTSLWPGALPAHLAWRDWAYLGGILGVAALLGDLTESLFKRDAGVKDSSVIPGLGGILDILDSLTFSTPILYLYLVVTHRLGLS